jgi:hypothetical protein
VAAAFKTYVIKTTLLASSHPVSKDGCVMSTGATPQISR